MRRPAYAGMPAVTGFAAALAGLLTARAWRDPLNTMPGLGGDQPTFHWYLSWWPRAVGAGENPWWTDRVAAPEGVNLMWNASMPLVAFVLAPVTALAGGNLTYTLTIVLGFVTTAVGALLLGRRIFDRPSVQALFAMSFAFSPFMAAHGMGHPNLIWAGYLPLTLRLLIDLGTGRTSPRRSGAFLGVTAAAQILIGEELVALTAICVAFVALWLLLTRLPLATWRRLASGVLWSQAWFWPLAAWPLGVQFFGPYRLSAPLHDTSRYTLDLLNLVAPTSVSLLTVGRSTVMDWSAGNVLESTGYLGIAVLVAVYAAFLGRRLPYVRAAAWCAVGALLIAVGDRVTIADRQTPIPGLGGLIGWIPLVGHVLPVRLTLVLGAAVLVLVCSLLDGRTEASDGATEPAARGRTASPSLLPAWVGLALVSLAPWPVYPASVTPPVPPFFRDGDAARTFGDSTVLALPLALMPESSTAMVWHAASGQRWRMIDGYVISNLFAQRVKSRRDDIGSCPACYWLDNRRSAVIAPAPAEVTDQLAALGVTWVVVGPKADGTMPAEVVRRVSVTLGGPIRDDGVLLWRLASP